MNTSPHIEIAEERAISCNTAASCLALVSEKIGTYCAIGDIRARMGRENAILPVSHVIEVAHQLGFTAQHLHGDWQWLELAVESRTVLLLLKNGNVIVAIGPGRLGVHELVVSDPLHYDGAMIVLPRENLERAWDGDAIALALQPGISDIPAAPHGLRITDQPRQITDQSRGQRRGARQSTLLLLSAILFCCGLIWLEAARILPPLIQKLVISTAPIEGPSAAAPAGLPAILGALPTDPEPSALASAIPAPAKELALSEVQPTAVGLIVRVRPELSSAMATASSTPPAEASALVHTDPVSEETPTPHKLKLSASDIAAFLARGDASLKAGDIASARLFYEHCAEAGDAGSAFRLGETFDPVFLGRTHLPNASSDMGKALVWYRRAGHLGSSEAQALLNQLKAN
jgi:hypothetical protein